MTMAPMFVAVMVIMMFVILIITMTVLNGRRSNINLFLLLHALDDFFQLSAVKPDPATLGTIIYFHTLLFG